MKAAVLYANEDIRYEENYPEPEVAERTVKVRVMASGICGSDVPRVLDNAARKYPLILGHEFSGVVVETGVGVDSVEVGDHVAGVPLIPCFKCDDCKKGDYALCKHYDFIGSRRDGCFAEFAVVPEANVVKIDKDVPFVEGALFEPCAVALHAIECIDYKPGKKVAILGGGTIGLLAIQALKAMGECEITVFGRRKERLQLSAAAGADHLISTLDEGYMDEVNAITEGKGFDYIFETAGSTDTMKLAFEIAANKAEICFIGTPKKEMTFTVKEWENMNRKEFKLTGSWMSYSAPWPGKEWDDVAELFAKKQVRCIDGMIQKAFSLKDAKAAFELYKNNEVKGKILFVDDELL